MAIAAARALAKFAESQGLNEEYIIPRMDDWEVFPQVAAATAAKAIDQGVAALTKTPADLYESARETIKRSRDATHALMQQGFIAAPR